jgi:hypothetical protein
MSIASTNRRSNDPGERDAVDVWHRLLRSHPLRVEAPGTCTGRFERRFLRDFCLGIAELPDPIQDTLFILAHARGCAYALDALDAALRARLATRPLACGPSAMPGATGERAWHGRRAS